MLLICDSELSDRARKLRSKFFEIGYPCAQAAVRDISACLPVKLIVTYYDAFNEIRRGPYDDIFVIVIGNGFVNSALNAKQVFTEDEAVEAVQEALFRIYGIGKELIYPFGILASPGIFYAKRHMELYGNLIFPTRSEYMIFKYLESLHGEGCYFTPENIRRFCYYRPGPRRKNPDSGIAVHISNLNHKIQCAFGDTAIRSRRFLGYYFREDL